MMETSKAAATYKGAVQVTEQANQLYSVYTDTAAPSVAEETLLAWDCEELDVLTVCEAARC